MAQGKDFKSSEPFFTALTEIFRRRLAISYFMDEIKRRIRHFSLERLCG